MTYLTTSVPRRSALSTIYHLLVYQGQVFLMYKAQKMVGAKANQSVLFAGWGLLFRCM